MLSMNASVTACHVAESGPKCTPFTSLNILIPTPIVVDLFTTPGGATKIIKKFGFQFQ